MKNLWMPFFALLVLLSSCTPVFAQSVDKDLLVGKWKFVKATKGPDEKAFQYNGDPLLTFESSGRWITEDTNPNYRQSGTWKIEHNILVRDPEIAGSGDMQPYPRVIDKLTKTELVFYASPAAGVRTFTFYFTRIE